MSLSTFGTGVADTGLAYATPAATYPYLSPASTPMTADGFLSGTLTLWGVPLQYSCTTVAISTSTPGDGMTVSIGSKEIKITGCTDSYGAGYRQHQRHLDADGQQQRHLGHPCAAKESCHLDVRP